jgi:SAM-dependent methyltransferase
LNFYQRHVLPILIDAGCGSRAIRNLREAVVPKARGRVLELGIGSARNLPYYDANKVVDLVGIDPSREMWARGHKRVANADFPVVHHACELEHAPIEPQSIDSVVITYTLCTLPDPAAVLRALRRFLVPSAVVLFCEHGAAPDVAVRRWQDRLNGVWRAVAGGCNLNRDIPNLLRRTGFLLADCSKDYLPKVPKFLGYHCWGTAVPEEGREPVITQ